MFHESLIKFKHVGQFFFFLRCNLGIFPKNLGSPEKGIFLMKSFADCNGRQAASLLAAVFFGVLTFLGLAVVFFGVLLVCGLLGIFSRGLLLGGCGNQSNPLDCLREPFLSPLFNASFKWELMEYTSFSTV